MPCIVTVRKVANQCGLMLIATFLLPNKKPLVAAFYAVNINDPI